MALYFWIHLIRTELIRSHQPCSFAIRMRWSIFFQEKDDYQKSRYGQTWKRKYDGRAREGISHWCYKLAKLVKCNCSRKVWNENWGQKFSWLLLEPDSISSHLIDNENVKIGNCHRSLFWCQRCNWNYDISVFHHKDMCLNRPTNICICNTYYVSMDYGSRYQQFTSGIHLRNFWRHTLRNNFPWHTCVPQHMLRKLTEELAYSSIIWRRYQEVMEIWGTSKSISQLRHTWEVSGNWIWRMTSIEFNGYQEVAEIWNTLNLIFQLRHIWQGSNIRYQETGFVEWRQLSSTDVKKWLTCGTSCNWYSSCTTHERIWDLWALKPCDPCRL